MIRPIPAHYAGWFQALFLFFMIIRNLSFKDVNIPLRIPFHQSNQHTQTSASILVRIQTQAGIFGFGEACPRSYVTGESMHSVRRELLLIKPFLIGQSLSCLEEIPEMLELVRPHLGLSALCGLEMALLDAWARQQQTHVADLLGDTTPETYTYSGVVPIGPVQVLRPVLEAFQFSEVKIKLGSDRACNLARLQLVRELYGYDLRIRVDANTAWHLEMAMEEIPFWLEQGIDVFEQILPPEEDENMLQIMKNFGLQAYFVADESLTTLDSAKRLVENGICNRLNLKISKHGGIFQALAIYDYANSHGVSCQLGAHYGETGLLTAAGLVFSALRKDITAREGALGTHLLKHDICTQKLKFDHRGELSLPFSEMENGWGLTILPEVLKDF